MAFKLIINGSTQIELSGDNIQAIDFASAVDMASTSRPTKPNVDLVVKGIITRNTEDQVKLLAQWSIESTELYREVTAQVIDNDTVVREYVFTEAFIVVYNENNMDQGSTFELRVRKASTATSEFKVEGGFTAE